jgi:hypothetical protein
MFCQVRAHLLGLGYTDVPDDVLEDFANEFISRLAFSSAARQMDQYSLAYEEDFAESEPSPVATSAKDSHAGRTKRDVKSVQKRGTRLSARPGAQESASGEFHGDREYGMEAANSGEEENIQPNHKHPAITNQTSPAQRKFVKKALSTTSERSTTSFIRPRPQTARIKRADPVAKYQLFKQVSQPTYTLSQLAPHVASASSLEIFFVHISRGGRALRKPT